MNWTKNCADFLALCRNSASQSTLKHINSRFSFRTEPVSGQYILYFTISVDSHLPPNQLWWELQNQPLFNLNYHYIKSGFNMISARIWFIAFKKETKAKESRMGIGINTMRSPKITEHHRDEHSALPPWGTNYKLIIPWKAAWLQGLGRWGEIDGKDFLGCWACPRMTEGLFLLPI